MQKHFLLMITMFAVLITGCGDENHHGTIKFAVCADYPPFEYLENTKLTGFDIELAELIAKKLDKKVIFNNINFAAIFPALQTGIVDAAISTIAITTERQKNCDFSKVYYTNSLAIIFPKAQPINSPKQLNNKKVACQLGTTMEVWLVNQRIFLNLHHVPFDNNNQAIEALKIGHVDAVITDIVQAIKYTQKYEQLSHILLHAEVSGYSIALRKGSTLTTQINTALQGLENEGEITKLQQKWIGQT